MGFVCKFCGSILSTQGTLKTHINTNKTCLKLRGLSQENPHKCEYCDYSSSKKPDYLRHTETCKYKIKSLESMLAELKIKDTEKDNIIILKNKEIEMLKTQLEERKAEQKEQNKQLINKLSKPSVINNNNNNLTINQKIEYCKSVLSPYSEISSNFKTILEEHIDPKKLKDEGTQHLIDVIINRVLGYDNKKYYLSIKPKDVFYWMNGDVIDIDDKANKLIDELYKPIKISCRKASCIYNRDIEIYEPNPADYHELMVKGCEMDDIYSEILTLNNKDSPLRKKLLQSITSYYNVSKDTLRLTDVKPVEVLSSI